jgi:septal ring factor EnvC (AmiA/AmiB activator)
MTTTTHVALRTAAIIGATVGTGAAAFFGGQATRMSDDAIAAQRTTAVEHAVDRTEAQAERELDAKVRELAEAAMRHEHAAVRNARRATRKAERKRAARRAAEAREAGYSSGQSVGYSSGYGSGHSAGEAEGYTDGAVDGYITGLFEGW